MQNYCIWATFSFSLPSHLYIIKLASFKFGNFTKLGFKLPIMILVLYVEVFATTIVTVKMKLSNFQNERSRKSAEIWLYNRK